MSAEPRLPRVFIGPVEIAGYYSGLASALRGQGVDALSLDLDEHVFKYASDRHWPGSARLATLVGSRRSRTRPRTLGRIAWRMAEVLTRSWLLLWCMRRFDVFIFGFGITLLGGPELPLLRLAGKRLIFVFNGSDARPSYVDGAEMAASSGRVIDDAVLLARRKKSRIRWIERYADVIVSQPAFSHFFERPIVDFFRVGVPVANHRQATPEGPAGQPVRILHSPSNPEVKGSERIRATVEALRASGTRIEFVELRGVPNSTVRAEIERADFVIDQIYSDAPMVSFATEAALAGRPAIVGGYAWHELRAIYRDDSMPPVEACHPDHLAEAILRLATDHDYRTALGRRAHDFVATVWAPDVIADHYLSLIRGEIPEEWLFDPRRLRYVRGVGLTEDRARTIVAGVIAQGGRAALQLGDKPETEQAFVDFAEGR